MNTDTDVDVRVTLENHGTRLGAVENQVKELTTVYNAIQKLTLSVNELATNMKHMLEEQKEQGQRIKALESEPAERWNSAKKTVLTSVISTVAGAVAVGIIMLIAQYIR